jgi:uncharacterized membrane protein (UPF0127 family)
MIKKFIGTVICTISLLSANQAFAGEKEMLCSNPGAKVSINSKQLNLRIACTREQLTKGLMNVRDLPDNTGMLFVFRDEQNLTFWAKDTYIPIDIAYLNNILEIVDINTLKPLDETIIASRRPASYALEVSAGWFSKHNVKVGDRLEIR